MNEEMLSVLMDGEISPFETRRVLSQLKTDPEGLATWERYNAARAVLQSSFPSVPTAGFADKVMDGLKDDAALRANSGVKPWLAYAAAAAVAGVALFGLWQTSLVKSSAPIPTVAAVEPENAAPPIGQSEPQIQQVAAINEAAETAPDEIARLNSYLVNHSEHSAPSMMPYVRLVGFSTPRQ
jgi:negative regulator of sigma E activity